MRNIVKPDDCLFARFEVLELISKRLNLWRARDLDINETRLLAIRPREEEELEYLHRSVKGFKGLSAPGLIPLYEILSDKMWTAVVMGGGELLPLSLEKPFLHKELIPKFSKLSRGLNILHECGIYHTCVDYAYILCSTCGDISLLPPISRPAFEDDIVGLGRLFLKLLTAGKAEEDLVEPNHRVELLAERKPLPTWLNQLIADMLAGNTLGMRYVVQRFDEAGRMGKITITDELAAGLGRPITPNDIRSRGWMRLAMILAIALAAIITIIFWIRWAQGQSPKGATKSDFTVSTSMPEDNRVMAANQQGGHSVDAAELPSASELSVVRKIQPKTSKGLASSELISEVESALDSWLAANRDLERVGGDQWGGEKAKELISLAEKAEVALLKKDFKSAKKYYKKASSLANLLYRQRHDRMGKLISIGEIALEDNQAANAANAFRLALLIDPSHEAAKIGIQRAQTLDQVTTLIRKAVKLEAAGQLGITRALFLEALALDPFSQVSKDGVKRIDGAISEATFYKLISGGIHQLEQDKFKESQAILNEAAALRPSSSATRETTKMLNKANRLKTVQDLQEKAEAAELNQNWQLAHENYSEILRRIPISKVGQDGKSKVETIMRLKAELSHYLSQPDRLLDDDPRTSARLVVEEVQELQARPDELKSAAAKLMVMIQKVEIPVRVTLLSDGKTEVTVQRIRELGKFDSHELTLRPGSYTVVGTREGYRDVRHTLRIEPDVGPVQLNISCDESLF